MNKIDETEEIKDFIVLDIETTGLYYEAWDEPIEICAIKYINNKKVNIFHKYLHPYKKVPKKIEDLTGITNEFLVDKETKFTILPQLNKFIGNLFIVAHNDIFDVPFLNFWNNQLHLPLFNKRICTMRTFKNNTHQKKGNLAYALNYFSIINNKAHSAISDTQATAELFILMKNLNYNLHIVNNTEENSYKEIMKRICKSNYFSTTKKFLCKTELSNQRKNIHIDNQEIIKLFHLGKTPNNIYPVCNNTYDELLKLFFNYINFINVSKFYNEISDKKSIDLVNKMLKYCSSFKDLIDFHNEIFKEEPNLIFYIIEYKLRRCSDEMTYEDTDFNYFFEKAYTIDSIAKLVFRDNDFIENYFINWAFQNKNNKDKKYIIKYYITGKKRLQEILKDNSLIKNEKDKITLKLYNKNFFNLEK